MNAPTAIAPLVEANPVIVLVEPEKFDRFYEEIKREIDAHVPDLSTDKGRKAIASLAFKVARTKTAIDDAGKLLNEEARKKIGLVDEQRRRIRDRLDALKDEVRRPLTEWEEAEKARVERVKETLSCLQAATVITVGETSADLRARLADIKAIEIEEPEFQEYLAAARAQRTAAIDALRAGIDRLAKEEADRAELERLRQEAAAREAAEQKRLAAEKAEAERVAQAALEAERQRFAAEQAEKARLAAEQRAAAEAEAAKAHAEAEAARAEAAKLQAEQRRRDEEAAEADRKRRAEEAEAARREANKAHRGRIMARAKTAIMDLQVDEPTAKRIVLAIASGAIPHTSIEF